VSHAEFQDSEAEKASRFPNPLKFSPPGPLGEKMSTYEEDERLCDLIRKENQILLDAFESWILASGLAQSTAQKHRWNINFYINEFLLYETPMPASEGVDEVGMFLGYWFIRKAMWASATSIQSNVRSLKKFYEFMLERGEVSPEAVTAMKQRIKEDLPEWVATLKRYNDPAVNIENVWQV
jgi:hypothetical protein